MATVGVSGTVGTAGTADFAQAVECLRAGEFSEAAALLEQEVARFPAWSAARLSRHGPVSPG